MIFSARRVLWRSLKRKSVLIVRIWYVGLMALFRLTGLNIRAFNFGYFLPIGQLSRLSFDYQFKNHPSFEDDAVNGRFQITWGILLK